MQVALSCQYLDDIGIDRNARSDDEKAFIICMNLYLELFNAVIVARENLDQAGRPTGVTVSGPFMLLHSGPN